MIYNISCAGNIWHIPYETIQNKSQKLHKDRFPVGLPLNCIKLSNLKEGDIVLDPFVGSMTMGIACKELGMKFVGFEIDKIIFEKGKQRLGEFIKCPNCQQYINLEVNIYKDKNNNVYCKKCNTQIGEKEGGINEE